MTGKWFNLFDECAARCVQLLPQKEECNCSSPGDSIMYKSGSIPNSKRMLPKINKSCAITKVRILVESDTVNSQRHLESFLVKCKFHFLSYVNE